MAKPKRTHEVFNRLAAAEERFLTSEFLAPALAGGRVQVRIAGVVCYLAIRPKGFEGWGIFQPTSHSKAKLVRPAKLSERQRYLELFPLVRLILARRRDSEWLGVPAHRADTRFRIDGLVPIRLVEEAQLFELVQTRFDGAHFWYAGSDPRSDPAAAAYLRDALERMTYPDHLSRPGLTAEERLAYAVNYWPRYEASEEARKGREEDRLRKALEHAGAELRGYIERPDIYTVTYEVDGMRHVSAISKKDLSVQVAGICLSGEDAKFDLHSLVGVLREAQGQGGVVPVGDDNQGMAEDHYWRAHPRRRR